MFARFSSAFLLLLISATFVSADAPDTKATGHGPAWVDPGWRRTVARYAVTFDEQGLSTTVYDFEIQALNDKGAEAIAQQTIAYNSYFEELSAGDLATAKTDGLRSMIVPSAISRYRQILRHPTSTNGG